MSERAVRNVSMIAGGALLRPMCTELAHLDQTDAHLATTGAR